jgi:hypothetical protein
MYRIAFSIEIPNNTESYMRLIVFCAVFPFKPKLGTYLHPSVQFWKKLVLMKIRQDVYRSYG